MSDFNVGDKVIVIKTEFTDEEWINVGRVDVYFNIGDELTISKINKDYLEFEEKITNCYVYPIAGFKLICKTIIKKNKEKSMESIMLDVLNKTYDNTVLRRRTAPLFMSNPGTGKTSIIKKFVKDKGVKMVKITLSQRMPNEVVGMVMPDSATGKLLVYDSHELTSLNDGDVLFFDEVFNGTLKQTLDAVLNLLEDRMLPSGKPLADVMIVAASNPQGLINLTPQIKERFIRYDLKFNKPEYQKLLKDRYGMPESISSNLCTLISKEKFEPTQWNYCTSRSIEKAINQIGCELDSPYSDLLIPFLSEEIEMPLTITKESITKGEKVQYLKLLKLIIQNDSKNNKQESGVTSDISN